MHALAVSGLVEFSYYNSETKTSVGTATQSEYLSQFYALNLSAPVFDPRLLTLSGGVSYNIVNPRIGPDSTNLNYSLSAGLLPQSKVSLTTFASKTTSTTDAYQAMESFDIDSTTVGGVLSIRMAGKSNGNNNNNWNRSYNNRYNNNNNNGGRSFFRALLPDINLSYSSTESESTATTVNRFDQVRDRAEATVTFPANKVRLTLHGATEDFEDRITKQSYDTTTGDFQLDVRATPSDTVHLNGTVVDRTTKNFVGFAENAKSQTYRAWYDHGGKNRLRQHYSYEFNDSEEGLLSSQGDHLVARLYYNLSPALELRGGLLYDGIDFERRANPAVAGDIGERITSQQESLEAGIRYYEQYALRFLGPFALRTDYLLTTGSSKYTNETKGTSGSGWYYQNDVRVGVTSTSSGPERVSVDYAVLSKRDDSPAQNDVFNRTLTFFLSTVRIPYTSLSADANYSVIEESLTLPRIDVTIAGTPPTNQQNRRLRYNITASHTLSSYVRLSEGATSDDTSSQKYTLSSLLPAVEQKVDVYFIELNYVNPVTRRLSFSSRLREEQRNSKQSVDYRQDLIDLRLNYRYRLIFCTLEYEWKNTVPDNSEGYAQQRILAKISRPF